MGSSARAGRRTPATPGRPSPRRPATLLFVESACASARTGRLASGITVSGLAADVPAGVDERAEPCKASTWLLPSSSGRSMPPAIRRAAAVQRAERASTSPRARGFRRGVRAGSSSAARAVAVLRRRMAIPATTSSWAALAAGGNGAASSSAKLRSASSRRPISSKRRTSRCRAWAASNGRHARAWRGPPDRAIWRASSVALLVSAGDLRPRPPRARGPRLLSTEAGAALRTAPWPDHQSRVAPAMPRSASGRRIVMQGDVVQGAERIPPTARECAASASPFQSRH